MPDKPVEDRKAATVHTGVKITQTPPKKKE